MTLGTINSSLCKVVSLGLVIGMVVACQQQSIHSPTPTVQDINQPVPLEVGQTQDLVGTLAPNETIHFLLIPQMGQKMTVELEGRGVQMAILDQNSQVLEEGKDLKTWQGVATYSGQYYVRLIPVPGSEKSEYKVTLGLKVQ